MMERKITWFLRSIVSLLLLGRSENFDKLKIIYSWKALEFDFPNEHARELAIQEGRFIPGTPVPIDVDFYNKDRDTLTLDNSLNEFVAKGEPTIFISIPRFQNGVPVTLGYVTDKVCAKGNPIIAPYPNWEWNRLGQCDALTSVFRMQVDSCDRLWVLDTGKLEERQICSPQLLSFNLRTNKLLSRYKFPQDQFKDDSLFVTPVVDIRDDKCSDTFVYIADVTGFELLVYDHRNFNSWKITNKLFFPYPSEGTYHIKGETFDLMDGIIGLALSPLKQDGDRILYFHSLASKVENYVPTSIIRNYSLFEEHSNSAPRSFRPFALERSSQSAAETMDQNGILFFGLLSKLAIACWNSVTYPEYGGPNNEIVYVNDETMQFPSGMKVITGKNGRQELWVLTSSFQKVMTSTMNTNETNFWIQAGYTDELVRGTKCNGGFDRNRAYGTIGSK